MLFAPLLIFICTAFILVATCTSNAHDFLYHQIVNFTFVSAPSFSDLLIVSDINLTSEFYLIQKMGHLASFGLLYFFLFSWIKKPGTAFLYCGLFACSTEVLQLYFKRNGRLFDVGIDLAGICIAYLISKYLYKK
ncbi:VanZ family protein [Filibacter tadaridae]|uniref:Putative membrane protein YwnJ n=1 Tax=Filibacter tadaridae TaxID=2483811 RepID=A0A3P5X3P8_9BACL|nr:putative membrane protein YwnJ [Filibacter tadaridae]